MTSNSDPPFDDQLARIDFSLAERLDWSRGDPETTVTKVRLLTAAATYFNIIAIADFGGRNAPARDVGLVEQVLAAAFQTFGGEDPHPTPFEKAAMILRGITQGHPFNDGNKRTGFLTAAYYLDLVGLSMPDPLPVDAVVSLCLHISAGELREVEAIAYELQALWEQGVATTEAPC